MRCPRCHSENPDSSRYCGNCTALLAPAEESPGSLTTTLEVPPDIAAAGSIVAGRYRVEGKIGQGGMGVVNKAEDLKLKRRVALKFLPPHLVGSAELREGSSQKPLFDLLGTPNKQRVLDETDHIPTTVVYIKVILAWLDRTLGSVRP
jgi:serine/threonine protein kinase